VRLDTKWAIKWFLMVDQLEETYAIVRLWFYCQRFTLCATEQSSHGVNMETQFSMLVQIQRTLSYSKFDVLRNSFSESLYLIHNVFSKACVLILWSFSGDIETAFFELFK
jgi:hypothetical protein